MHNFGLLHVRSSEPIPSKSVPFSYVAPCLYLHNCDNFRRCLFTVLIYFCFCFQWQFVVIFPKQLNVSSVVILLMYSYLIDKCCLLLQCLEDFRDSANKDGSFAQCENNKVLFLSFLLENQVSWCVTPCQDDPPLRLLLFFAKRAIDVFPEKWMNAFALAAAIGNCHWKWTVLNKIKKQVMVGNWQ